MASEITGGVVVYVQGLANMGSFYAAVTGLAVAQSDNDHVALESPTFQLVLVKIPDHVADSIEVADPPARREDTALKPMFVVASIGELRAVVADLGGELDPLETEWSFGQWLVCDGHDPEGNVIQLRQLRV